MPKKGPKQSSPKRKRSPAPTGETAAMKKTRVVLKRNAVAAESSAKALRKLIQKPGKPGSVSTAVNVLKQRSRAKQATKLEKEARSLRSMELRLRPDLTKLSAKQFKANAKAAHKRASKKKK